MRPGHNTEYSAVGSCKLYVTLTDETPGAGQARVSVYKDSARTLLVAQGEGANSTTITLSEQNNSGLSGTVALATPSATNSSIELTINTISISFADTFARYFTLFKNTAQETEKVVDCVVKSISFASADNGSSRRVCRAHGQDVLEGFAGVDCGPQAATVYAHNQVAVRSAVDSTPVTENASAVEFAIENEIFAPLANASSPAKLIKRYVDLSLKTTHVHSDEAQVLIDANSSFQSVDVTYTSNSKVATFTWDKAKPVDPQIPRFTDREVQPVELEWICEEDQAASPTSPLTVTYQP